MHRSRPFVLVILAAAAACSKHDPSEGNDILSQDRTLVARLESDKVSGRLPLPNACGAITVAVSPPVAKLQQAEELTRQAGVAEMHGNIPEARSLLRRASALDGTNKSAAYHLGRTSEALGDRSTAMTAYCRYLALAPTAAESVEARQRVADLSRTMSRATASVRDSVATHRGAQVTATRRTARTQSTVGSRVVASSTPRRSLPATSSARVTRSPSVVPSGSGQPQTPSEPPTTSAQRGGATSEGDVVARSRPVPTTEQPSTVARTQRRGTIGAQSAIIGAAAGAIFGAATGRSVKSTVIGAAAGGVLGTVVGSATRPAGRGTRS